jgi:putative spermidine/putrescine transport system ATP-binding protein
MNPSHIPQPEATAQTQANASPCEAAPVLVSFKNVCKSYGKSDNVVSDLNLQIHQGEFLTLLGPSGSGKTTSLMMLAGFEEPSSGSIEMDGRRINAVPSHKRDIGVVFQNYALFPHLTIAQNLAFPLEVRKTHKHEIQRRVGEALELVHLGKLGDRRPAQLSGGQQQRIALARALIFKPRLIVLDEPLGALDKSLREHMQLELKRLHRELGVTMVFVTHDQSEALTMSDRVAVFDQGRIQQIASPQRLYSQPATRFVASFIGENNLIECEVVDCEAGTARLRTAADGELFAQTAACPPPGSPVTFALRPEQIEIETSSGPTSDPRRRALRGRVSDIIFLGDQQKLLVDVPGIGELVVRISTRFGMQAIAAGDYIPFSYWVELGHMFPSGGPLTSIPA